MLQSHLNRVEQEGTRDATKALALMEAQGIEMRKFQDGYSTKLDKLLSSLAEEKQRKGDVHKAVVQLEKKLARNERLYFWRTFLEILLLISVISLIIYPDTASHLASIFVVQ